MATRRLSEAGRRLLEQREGCRLTAYRDQVGVLTIGVGHTGRASSPVVIPGMKITQGQADAYFEADLEPIEAGVDGLLKLEPTQHQFDALISLVHNIGMKAFEGSHVLRLFNANDILAAADAFTAWNRAGGKVNKGLVNRRAAERLQFLTADAPQAEGAPAVQVGEPMTLPGAVLGEDVGFWARGMRALAYWFFAIPLEEK